MLVEVTERAAGPVTRGLKGTKIMERRGNPSRKQLAASSLR